MADPAIPSEWADYMRQLDWPEHHERWHYEQRYDWWRHRAAHHPQAPVRAAAQQMVAYGDSKNWTSGAHAEGAPGHGLHFLAMHRAMIALVAARFPQHAHLLAGWKTPPLDPKDPDNPVAGEVAFDANKALGIQVVETGQAGFASEDEFALFLETSIRPTASDPTNLSTDPRTGLHNYLHNRWADGTSPLNLGDPRTNLFNARFWRLHGWIDNLWTAYRKTHGLPDDEPAHVELLEQYRHMMEHGGHHHLAAKTSVRRPVITSVFLE